MTTDHNGHEKASGDTQNLVFAIRIASSLTEKGNSRGVDLVGQTRLRSSLFAFVVWLWVKANGTILG